MREADERRRQIARLLHDGPAQLVAAAAMSLELLQREESALPQASREALAGSRQLLQECARELSRLSHDEHPPFVGEGGLLTAVLTLARRMGDRVQLQIETPRPLAPLGLPAELGAYRLLERALERSYAPTRPVTVRLSLPATGRERQLTLTLLGTPTSAAAWPLELRVLQQRARLASATLVSKRQGRQRQLDVRFTAPPPTSIRKAGKKSGGP